MSFLYFIPLIFVGMWIFITYIISKMGWESLVKKYKTDKEFEGTRVGITSLGINSATYQNSIVLKYSSRGIYLRPIFFYRLFHPPVLIPWSEIKDVRDKKILFISLKELVIGDPFVALITMKKTTYNKIEKTGRYNSGRSPGFNQ